MVNLNNINIPVGFGTRRAMSLQIRVQEIRVQEIRVQDLVGEWLAVPQTQRKDLTFPPTLFKSPLLQFSCPLQKEQE